MILGVISMDENRKFPEQEDPKETEQARRDGRAPSEEAYTDLHSDGTIYPPRQEDSENRYRGYASTGYGGVNGQGRESSRRADHAGKQPVGENTAQQDFGVDPFSGSGPQGRPREERPYGMTGTYEWNFADYDQQGTTPPGRNGGRHGRTAAIAASVLAVVLICVFAGYSVYSMISSSREGGSGESSSISTVPGLNIQDKPQTTAEETNSDGKLSNKEIIKKVSPAVVGIECYTAGYSFSPSSSGSGIIMTADGYIVTNAHVIEGAAGITVMLENGDTYTAQLIGSDTDTDLAVLKINASNLTYAEFGNSDELERGDAVIAIGNPGGTVLAGSTTGGMVSGINRNINSSSPYSTTYIQVDAAINPGNSGGALVNEYGQVVGINSAKIAETDYEGIGFAIPINEALPIIEQLMQYGHVTGRAALGISGYMINDAVATMRRLPVGFGIESVEPDSDLNVKNVQAGDIITHINDKEVTSYDVLSNELAQYSPGSTVKLTVYRPSTSGGTGKSFEVNVVLIESTGN